MSSPADESELLLRLQQRRREIDQEVETFKALKEEEYRAFDQKLCEEFKHKKRKQESYANSTAAAWAAGEQHEERLPVDDAPPRAELQGPHVQESPPFDKDLQDAFTPRYLPLLDKGNQSPPVSSFLQASATSPMDGGPLQSTVSALAMGLGHSPVPLAPSLKSSPGSSLDTGTADKSPVTKQKSPKRVTFQFEDENSVPSRSSPPPAKVRWSLVGDLDSDEDDDGGFTEHLEKQEVVDVGAEGFEQATARDVEEVESVLPVKADALVAAISTPLRDGDSFEEIPFGSATNINGETTNPSAGTAAEDDVYDGEVFDMDETIPEVQGSPPQRDYAALHNTFKPLPQRSPFSGHSFPPLPSFTPTPSAPAYTASNNPLLTFSKSLANRSGFTAVRNGASSSFTPPLTLSPIPPRPRNPSTAPVASSLPNIAFAAPARLRRRSIAKYSTEIPDEDTPTPPGRSPQQSSQDIGEEYGQSPNAQSMPMSIRPSPTTIAQFCQPRARTAVPSNGESRPSLPQPSRYRTALAAEVAAAAGEGSESVIGGVDGGTGLDGSYMPDIPGPSLEDIGFERMSLKMRMAFEDLGHGR